MNSGWISLHRSIQEHWIWDDPKKLKWWIDLILMANHSESKILINNELIIIERGERHTSEEKLASRWNVSRNTVRKFLDILEKDEMISVKKSRQSGTTYKVTNYNVYQDNLEIKKHQTEQRLEHQTEQQKDNGLNNELNINNNDNNVNNENNNMSSKLDNVSEETKKTDHVDDDSEVDSGKVSSKKKNDSIPYDEIVEYLNQKAGTNFRSGTPATQRLIKARLSEGFTVENFKSVIDIKTSQWLNNQKMNQYLRPQTLFGTKFESYLNENSKDELPEYLTYEEVELIGDDIELPF